MSEGIPPDGSLVTLASGDRSVAGRYEDGRVLLLDAPDAGEVLRRRSEGQEPTVVAEAAGEGSRRLPVVPRPGKIICVGLNYASHIAEMGRDRPEFPTLFAKYPEALIGPEDDLVLPVESTKVDWEAELCVVVGAPVRSASASEAHEAIAGYTVINDVTARDWQHRTLQWLQGKSFEATCPLGPVIVPRGSLDVEAGTELRGWVGDDMVQSARTDDLVFGPVDLVQYISRIVTLQPGDLIATGTPGGVGAASDPPRFLAPGDVLRTEIAGIGELVNTCRAPS